MSTTALIVIDVQAGAFDGVRYPPVVQADRVLANTLMLLSAARDAGVSRIFVQHLAGEGGVLEAGSPQCELHAALSPRPDERIIRKSESSSFDGTELAEAFEQAGVSRLVVCGLQSQYCVYDTATDALRRGYAVTLAIDAHTTWPSERESAAAIRARVNAQLRAAGATVLSTAELAAALRGLRNPEPGAGSIE